MFILAGSKADVRTCVIHQPMRTVSGAGALKYAT